MYVVMVAVLVLDLGEVSVSRDGPTGGSYERIDGRGLIAYGPFMRLDEAEAFAASIPTFWDPEVVFVEPPDSLRD